MADFKLPTLDEAEVMDGSDTSRSDIRLPQAIDAHAPIRIGIEGVSEPVISHYFETLNAEDFAATAALFVADGILYPPFESPVVGAEAIVTFLESEAKGMQLQPRQGISQTLETGETQVKVTGKVQTPLFGVNVDWLFALNSQSQILSVAIRLLASPQELLTMQS